MGKRAFNYDNLIVNERRTLPPEEEAHNDAGEFQDVGELLKDVAQQIVAYITPEAHKAFAQFALEQSSFRAKVKPHDLYIEALTDWLRKHGIDCEVRAKESLPRRRRARRQ